MRTTITKALAFFIAIIFTMLDKANAQAPQAISYQAVVRNASGTIIPNKMVGLRFGIRDGSITGTLVYVEEQKATTNALGLFSVNVGQGNLVFGYQALSTISWESGSKFLQVEIDTAGGSTYTMLGAQQLMSVPYALSAGNGVPVGTVCAFAGSTPPAGWLLCNGDTLNRVTYKSLFTVLGVMYGNGNGTSTFKLPDYRGQFLRGIDGITNNVGNTSFNDPDRFSRTVPPNSIGASATGVGSSQTDAFQGHQHFPANGSLLAFQNIWGTNGLNRGAYGSGSGLLYSQDVSTPQILYSDGVNGTARNSSESRPKNVYVNYIIKY